MLISTMKYEDMYREIKNDFRELISAVRDEEAKFHQFAKRAKHYPYGRVYSWHHPKSHNIYTYFFQVKRHSEWDKEPRRVIYTEFDDEGGKTTIAVVNAQSGIMQISIFRPHFFKRYYERNLAAVKGDVPDTEREIKLAFLSRTSTVVFLGNKVVTQNELDKEEPEFESDAMLTTEGLIFFKRLKANPNIKLFKTYIAPKDLYTEQYEHVLKYAIHMFYQCALKDSPRYKKGIDKVYLDGINELNSMLENDELSFEEKQKLRISRYQAAIDELQKYTI